MDLIFPRVKAYDWGSRHVIAALQGREVPSDGPEAELWMGAHPSGPARVDREGATYTLDQLIADDPVTMLGADVARRFGGRLPFLLKVLAAENALSIQVHPDHEQAKRGFAAEQAAGIDVADPRRSYVDDWPKPEVLCALTEFEVLAGFREPDEAARMLQALDVPELAPIISELRSGVRGDSAAGEGRAAGDSSGDSSGDPRRTALAHLLELPADQGRIVAEATVAAARRLAGTDSDDAQSYAAVVRMAEEYPGDVGVVASLLLRHATLAPGEGLYMPAAGPHAYLRGAGIEVMANSDNVLRAGLTHKHIDAPELLRIIDPTVQVPVLRPEPDAHGIRTYHAPVPEFCLYVADLDRRSTTVPVPGAGPRIVFVTSGEVNVRSDSGPTHELTLTSGQACFLPAGADAHFDPGGEGTAFIATPGDEH